jgi:hypothetical protein
MSKPTHQQQPAPAKPPGAPDPHKKHGLLDEEHFHVPKGIPRWQFLLLISLMIIMLITFLVPGPIMSIFGGRGGDRNPVFASWERPGHGTVEWRTSDIQGQERALSAALRADPYLSLQVGIGGNPSPRTSCACSCSSSSRSTPASASPTPTWPSTCRRRWSSRTSRWTTTRLACARWGTAPRAWKAS